MPETMEEEREVATMDAEDAAEETYRKAQAATAEAVAMAQRAEAVLRRVEATSRESQEAAPAAS